MLRKLVSILVVAVIALSGCSSAGDSTAVEAQQNVATHVSDDAGVTDEGSDTASDDSASAGDEAARAPTPTLAASPIAADSDDPDSDSADADEVVAEFLTIFERFRWQRAAELGHIPIGDIEAIFGADLFPQQLPPGEYATKALGTEISFRLDHAAILAREFPGMLSFVGVDLVGTLHVARPVNIFTPEGAISEDAFFNYRTGTEPMPDDFDQWLRSIAQINVGDARDTTIGGQPATRYELTTLRDEFAFCNRGTCLSLFLVGPDKIQLFGHQRAVLWHVPHPGGDIVIATKANDEAFDDWLAFTDQVLESLSFGEAAASPLSSDQYWGGFGTVGEGQWWAPGVPWSFDFEFAETALNHKNGYLSAAPVNERRGILLAKFVETRDGLTATVASIDQVLRDKYDGLLITELEPAVVLGHEARVFDIGPKPGDLEFKHAEDAPGVDVLGTDNFALVPTPGRMWAFEHDGELWIFQTGAMNEDEFPVTLEWAERVLESGLLRAPTGTPLGEQFSVVEPGAYVTEALGFPMTIETDDRWLVQSNTDGVVDLAAADPVAPGDYSVVFTLPSSLEGDRVGAGFQAWLDAAPATVVVGRGTATSIGEGIAQITEVRLSQEAECAIDDSSCVLVFTSAQHEQWLSRGSTYRFIWFEDDIPVVAVVTAPSNNQAWLDTGLALVESASFVAR